MKDLRKLIEAVEGGDMESPPIGKVFGFTWKTKWASAAYNGSLDAAKSLHEALLPEWMLPCIVSHISNGVHGVTVELYQISGSGESVASNNCMARAWLLAVLQAYEAQQ